MSHASVIVAIEPTHKLWTTGVPEQAVAWEMEPFDENGSWFADGSRWDWWVIGGRYSGRFCGQDVVLLKDLQPNKCVAFQEKRLKETYAKAMSEKDEKWMELCYGVKPNESEADFLSRNLQGEWFPSSFAFLKDRHWHETGRLGWFGSITATECELAGRKDAPEWKCLYKHESGARVVSWNSDEETWRKKFYSRFIQPLSPETTLVCVDYHV